MEKGSPAKSTSSTLEQTKQSYYELLTHEFNSGMPYFLTARQLEKRPRFIEAEEPQSYLALLTAAIQNSDTQQIGPSFSRAPLFVPYGNSDFDTQQTSSTLNVMLETPTPFRSMGIQGTRNPTDVPNSINLACGGSNYACSSRFKRKMTGQDDIAANSRSWNSFYRGDQGYSSSSYGSFGHGYSLYDERYQALGLPVDPHLRMFNAIYGKGKGGST